MEVKVISNDLWRALERDIITALEVAGGNLPRWLVPTLLLSFRLTLNRAVLEALTAIVGAIERDDLLLPILREVGEGETPEIPTIEKMLQSP